MKEVSIFLIKQYQKLPVKSHFSCKYIPTCSNYAIETLNNYGFFKGWYLAIKRILRCNPFSKGGLDPVPIKENKNEKRKKIV